MEVPSEDRSDLYDKRLEAGERQILLVRACPLNAVVDGGGPHAPAPVAVPVASHLNAPTAERLAEAQLADDPDLVLPVDRHAGVGLLVLAVDDPRSRQLHGDVVLDAGHATELRGAGAVLEAQVRHLAHHTQAVRPCSPLLLRLDGLQHRPVVPVLDPRPHVAVRVLAGLAETQHGRVVRGAGHPAELLAARVELHDVVVIRRGDLGAEHLLALHLVLGVASLLLLLPLALR